MSSRRPMNGCSRVVTNFLIMRRILFFALLAIPALGKAQIDSINVLKPAAVTAVTSEERAPFATTDLTEEDIQKRDAAQDMPFMLRFTPSMVVTSDAGNGIGYTNLRLRGTDATRINVTINGVPLNDAESMGVWWVDLPDLASSVSDVQIHRGVGTSTNGPSAFGGSIAINTLGKTKEQSILANIGYGSFNSQRATVNYNSGIIGNNWAFEGRYSQVTSDGYLDRATSDLTSMFGSLTKYFDNGSKLSITHTHGEERTYQAWYGVPQIAAGAAVDSAAVTEWAAGDWTYGNDSLRLADLIANGRQHNYYNYENEVDDYTQTHSQLHYETEVSGVKVGAALFQTLGSGFYEQQKLGEDLADYGIADVIEGEDTISSTNLIRRRWLDNTLRGALINAETEIAGIEVDFGGMYSQYEGGHFGKIIAADVESIVDDSYRYYESMGYKNDASAYARATWYGAEDALRVQAEAQIRNVQYSSEGLDSDRREFVIGDTLTFFNPKVGFDYLLTDNSRFYASVAVANREPSRGNYLDAADPSAVLPEELMDIELGYRVAKEDWAFEIGAYHMDYTNQLIPTGVISDVGAAVKQNVEESYRQGLELQAGKKLNDRLRWEGNLTLSNNKILNYVEEQVYTDTSWNEYTFQKFHEETDIAYSPGIIGASIFTIDAWNGKPSFLNEAVDVDVEVASKYVGDQYMDNTMNEEKMISAYLVHDVVIRCSTKINGKELGLNLFVNNILDEVYSTGVWTYSALQAAPVEGEAWNSRHDVYVSPQAGRNGFASLTYKF